jgi:hypothetical protein
MATTSQLIKSYEKDIEDLKSDVRWHGHTKASLRTLARLERKLRELRKLKN